MKIAVVAPGRWHAFDLARELHQKRALDRLVTNYPKWKTRRFGIPDEKVHSFFWHYLASRFFWEVGGERLDMALTPFFFPMFGRMARKACLPSRQIHVWSGAALEILKTGTENRQRILLDRASSHRVEQDRILSEELQAQGGWWPNRPPSMIRRELEEYRRSDGIVVPSLFVEQTFLRQGVPREKIHMAGLGVNLQAFQPQPLPKGTVRAIYAGSLSIRKGIPRLLRAFRKADLPEAELLLVGGETPEIRRLLRKLPPRVKRVGHVPQSRLSQLYATGSFFVMPSLEEGQAMVQLQALACGLPLICTAHTGGEDLLRVSGPGVELGLGIREFPAGFLVPPADEHALAEAMRKIVRTPGLLEKKRGDLAQLNLAPFSWGSYAERILAIHEKVAHDVPGK